jgi:hypothetical protein
MEVLSELRPPISLLIVSQDEEQPCHHHVFLHGTSIVKQSPIAITCHSTQICHKEMGSNGNYQVVGCYDSSRLLEDNDKPTAITLTHVADVPEVDMDTLDLSRFTAHLDHAELADTPVY